MSGDRKKKRRPNTKTRKRKPKVLKPKAPKKTPAATLRPPKRKPRQRIKVRQRKR